MEAFGAEEGLVARGDRDEGANKTKKTMMKKVTASMNKPEL